MGSFSLRDSGEREFRFKTASGFDWQEERAVVVGAEYVGGLVFRTWS